MRPEPYHGRCQGARDTDGEAELIPQREVVVGDIISVETGNKFPADARLIESSSLTADESALTGESMPAGKEAEAVFADPETPLAERANMLYSGCFATGGGGLAVVTAVGDATSSARSRELSAAESSATRCRKSWRRWAKGSRCSPREPRRSFSSSWPLLSQRAPSLETVSEAFITSRADRRRRAGGAADHCRGFPRDKHH
ncbi:MAG: hypothetical protein ACLUEQ_05705 [Cloacibacillus evryensis]